jgi:HPt (histidine-containing phosphotransfer) domain-containing protein
MKQAHLEVQNLHIFSQEGKWDEVSKSAHRLKSASFQIGAGRVGELSNEIETTLRLGQSGASLLPLISELRKDYDETLRLLREYLDKLIS